MNILFYGSGVIGSVIAVKLGIAGHRITVLARGTRLRQIRENGIIIRNGITGEVSSHRPEVVEHLGTEDYYDLAIVPVRADHLPVILPALAANKKIPDILIMVNNPKGYQEIIDVLGWERFLIGFPGLGGGLTGDTVKYTIANPLVQPTTFGEIDGKTTGRLLAVKTAFKNAGFPVAIEKNIEAWQKTHVCWIMPFAAAIYKAGSSPKALSARPDILRQMVMSIRETFRALGETGIKVTPSKLKVFEWLPLPVLVKIMQIQCASPEIEIVAGMHVNNAPVEMRQLGDDLLRFIQSTGVRAEATEDLMRSIPG